MPAYSIVSPYLVNINAGDLTSAVRQFTKLYYRMKINEIIIKDQMKHYRATLKYFKENNKNRVGIRMFPHMYPIAPSTIPISSVYTKYASTYHKDGTIKDYVHSPVNPAILVTSKTTVDTDADSDGSKASFVMSPMSPMSPLAFMGLGRKF